MSLVVLDIPCLWEHPVHPVYDPSEADGEDTTLVLGRQSLGMRLLQLVKASM